MSIGIDMKRERRANKRIITRTLGLGRLYFGAIQEEGGESMEGFVYTGLGIILGGMITFLCSKYYYKRASDELQREAVKLKDLINIILCAMESLDWIELETDGKGNITGFSILKKIGDQVFKLPVLTK